MIKANAIGDLLIEPLPSQDDGTDLHLNLLSFDDHLLRRFGQIDLIRKVPGDLSELRMRSAADEVWILIEGSATCICRDLRPGSPSQSSEILLDISAPTRLLVPFGVAFGWKALEQPALMLRCATHQDGDHPEDKSIPLEASG